MSKPKQTDTAKTLALFKAADKGDVAKLKTLLAENHRCDFRDHTGKTALMHAAEHGHLEATRTLLQAGADATASVSDRDSIWFGCNALIFAARSGSAETVELLIAAGASPNCQAADGTTPLSFAVEHRSSPMVKVLLKADAPLSKDILVPAVWSGSIEISLLLIQAGTNVNACDDLGQSLLHRAAEKGELELLRALIQAKAKLDHKANGATPLLVAIENRHTDCALELIQAGADLFATTLSRRDALMTAAVTGQARLVQALLKAGANPNAKDKEGKTALMLANEKRHADIVKLLRAGGSDESGYNVQEFIRAASTGDVDRVRHFLQAGVDVNATYQNGAKALISAVMKGHTEVVRLLLDWGANAATRSTAKAWGAEFHADALALAADKGHLEIVRLLLKAGADANKSWMFHLDALNAAALEGHTEVVRELLKAGQAIPGRARLAALDRAIERKHEQTALVLIEAGVDVPGKPIANLLVAAAGKGLARVVKALLATGVDPKLRNEYDETALQAAQSAGHKAIAAILQKVSSPQASPGLELVEAAERGDLKSVHRLILEGVEVESRDARGATALIRASANGHLPVMKTLLAAGADPNAATPITKRDKKQMFHHMDLTFETPLSCAVSAQCLPAVEMLLHAGADIRNTECDHLACMLLQEGTAAAAAFVERLLGAGMDPNANWPVINVSLLEIAAQEGLAGLVNRLICSGARLSTPVQRDRAIVGAIQDHRREIAQMLIEHGVAPQVKGVITTEALVYAAIEGFDDIVLLLLKRGVKIDKGVKACFQDEGALEGITPLMAAACHGRVSTVELLLKAGANPQTEDAVRRTALDWAQDNKSKNVAQKICRLLENAAALPARRPSSP